MSTGLVPLNLSKTPTDVLQVLFERVARKKPPSPHLEPIFMELIARNQPDLVHFFASRVKHLSDAEDLLQITLGKAFDGRVTYSTRLGSFRQWLFGIAKNTLSNHFRALHREQVHVAPWDLEAGEPESPSADPERAFLAKDEYRLLEQSCCEEHDKKLLEALKRKKVERQSWNQIHRDMGWEITPESLRVECYRLEKRLRRVREESNPRRNVT